MDLHQKKRRWRWISIIKREDGGGSPSEKEKTEVDLHQNSRRRRSTSGITKQVSVFHK
jgi:hypothetical protein